MTPKTKIVIGGFGLVALNVFVLAMLLYWPAQTQEPTTSINRSSWSQVDSSEHTGSSSIDVGIDVDKHQIPTSMSDARMVSAENSSEATQEQVKDTTENISVEVDSHYVPVYTKGTVLDAMEAYRDASGTFTFSGKQYPGLGMFIEEIQGRRAADGYYWILYINDDTADLGVSRAEVVPGDIVEWRFEPNIY
jgi:hypothetical protein